MLYQLSYLAPAGECSRVDQPSRGGGRRDLRPGRVASAAVAATPRTVTIVGAPLDLGQGRRGVDMGPSAIRYADLEERLTSFGCVVVDRGNVIVPEPEALALRDERIRFLPEILEACAKLAAIVEDVVGSGSLPLVLGGEYIQHSGGVLGLRQMLPIDGEAPDCAQPLAGHLFPLEHAQEKPAERRPIFTLQVPLQ